MLVFLQLLFLSALSTAIDPRYAKRITVFHVNEHKFGAVPLNMNTGDAVGDMFFDMIEVIGTPLFLPKRQQHESQRTWSKPMYKPRSCGKPIDGKQADA